MTTNTLNLVLLGALTMSAWVAGLFFLRFWHASRDRFFISLAISFWLLALNWLALALVPSVRETEHEVFLLRLLAFGLIIVGVIDKNRRSRR